MGEAAGLPLHAQLARALTPGYAVAASAAESNTRGARRVWSYRHLVLRTLGMRAAHGMRAEHCEQDDGPQEQREHARAAQLGGSCGH